LTSVSGNGTLGLNLVDDDSIAASSGGLKLDGTGTGNGNFTGQAYTIDQTKPTVALTSAVGSLTKASFTVTATFSESGSCFSSTDVTASNATVSGFSGSGTTYSWTVNPTGQGSVQVSLAAGVASDAAGNANTASNTISTTYDSVAPTATVTGPVSPTNSS